MLLQLNRLTWKSRFEEVTQETDAVIQETRFTSNGKEKQVVLMKDLYIVLIKVFQILAFRSHAAGRRILCGL